MYVHLVGVLIERKHHVSSCVSLLLRNLLSLSVILMRSPEVPSHVSVCSDISI